MLGYLSIFLVFFWFKMCVRNVFLPVLDVNLVNQVVIIDKNVLNNITVSMHPLLATTEPKKL